MSEANKVDATALLRRKFFFIMVSHPAKGWMRAGNAYASRKAAQGWVSFVRGAWRGLRTKVVACTVVWRNGEIDEKSRNVLDKKFNLDVQTLKGASPL